MDETDTSRVRVKSAVVVFESEQFEGGVVAEHLADGRSRDVRAHLQVEFTREHRILAPSACRSDLHLVLGRRHLKVRADGAERNVAQKLRELGRFLIDRPGEHVHVRCVR